MLLFQDSYKSFKMNFKKYHGTFTSISHKLLFTNKVFIVVELENLWHLRLIIARDFPTHKILTVKRHDMLEVYLQWLGLCLL